jgi:hypothetical protein
VQDDWRSGAEVELGAHVAASVEDPEVFLFSHLRSQVKPCTEGFSGPGDHDATDVAVAVASQELI